MTSREGRRPRIAVERATPQRTSPDPAARTVASPKPARDAGADVGARRSTQTALKKRSLSIAGHRTSVSLEDAFWTALKALAERRGLSLAGLVAEIDAGRDGANLSSALRVAILVDAHARERREDC
jgi:predicted DNA-binding ribbon-helix-helix protein